MSDTHAAKNQTSAGKCSSGFLENNFIWTILTVVHTPPPGEYQILGKS